MILNKFIKVLVVLLVFCQISCTKNSQRKEEVAEPKGFSIYQEGIPSNNKKNLLFFHLHHCANCDMTMNYLIKTKQFQEFTKNFNRYHLELGRPLGKKLMKKYGILGGPVFVLTDENFSKISMSPYGFLDMSEFSKWLQTGESLPPAKEVKILSSLLKKYPQKKSKNYMGLYQFFSDLKQSFEKSDVQKNKEFVKQASLELENWASTPFSKNEVYSNCYRIALSYWSLADLVKKIDESRVNVFLSKGLEQIRKISSGDVITDYGSAMLQIMALIQLNQDAEVEQISNKILQANPKNVTMLYTSLAWGYLTFKKDCEKVLKYTGEIPLKEIPVETERINLTYYRMSCHELQNNLAGALNDYKGLKKHISKEIQEAFPDKIDKMDKILEKMKTRNEKKV